MQPGDRIVEGISYDPKDYYKVNCNVLNRKNSDHHLFWKGVLFSLIVIFSVLRFYFFSERVVLVHMSDLERQHNSFTLCRPHLKALCETAIQGRFRASENLAITMEIVSKRGEAFSFFLLFNFYLFFVIISDVFRHILQDDYRKKMSFVYNLPLNDVSRETACLQKLKEINALLDKYPI